MPVLSPAQCNAHFPKNKGYFIDDAKHVCGVDPKLKKDTCQVGLSLIVCNQIITNKHIISLRVTVEAH